MQLKEFHTDLVVFWGPSSESVLADPLLLESNDFTPSTRSSTSESISDSSPLPTREAQSNIAADIKVILADQGKRVMILWLVVSAKTTRYFNKRNRGKEDFNPFHTNTKGRYFTAFSVNAVGRYIIPICLCIHYYSLCQALILRKYTKA